MMTVDPSTALTKEEIEEFAKALTYAPFPVCQVNPDFHRLGDCEQTATYALKTCKGHGLACEAAIRVVKEDSERGCICGTCGEPVADDWRYIAI